MIDLFAERGVYLQDFYEMISNLTIDSSDCYGNAVDILDELITCVNRLEFEVVILGHLEKKLLQRLSEYEIAAGL